MTAPNQLHTISSYQRGTQSEKKIQVMSTETNYAAIVEAPYARLTTVTRPIPVPGDKELVVRNHAIAVNPADWKMQDFDFLIKSYPVVLGSDVCGIVAATGSSVTKFKIGDRATSASVTGFAGVIYIQDNDHGAFQTFTTLKSIATTRIPDSMNFEDGAVFPMALATSGMALFVDLGIPLPTSPIIVPSSGLLIWGAGSSVGTTAIQIAKKLGFKVFATASPSHHQYLKSLGAFEVFDYRDPAVVDNIVASATAAGTPISLGFDTITEEDTAQKSSNVVLYSSTNGSGKLVLVNEWPKSIAKPDGLQISQTMAFRHGSDKADIGEWLFNDFLREALEDGTIVPAPRVELVPGGIDVAQTLFDRLKAGVSGKKLVIKVE
ncbi:related to oxidoreductase [Rhynchosporium agropyri]|uniref:Related to oxidoreductase n=1 Tax=Rhynchosporium agropyri TaxID=914238 RepID=A0A1E1KZQ9_9HELO|nr:related to oxidoreductase [Rhynchosporium agropyri]